jgi:DMSO/TMAO reductase YedYZ heme-binding membrane subunit
MFTRYFAMAGFFMLCVSLIIGPLVTLKPQEFGQLLEPRRAVGVIAFLFIAMHFVLVFALTQGFDISFTLNAPELFIGLPPLLVFFALAVTSSNAAIKALSFPNWKLLHRLTYSAFLLSFAHFLLKSNGLFVKVQGGQTFLSLAEVLLVALGFATIILQAIGFLEKRKRKQEKKVEESKEAPDA